MGDLSKYQIAFLDMLSKKHIGDFISLSDILKNTGWKKSTFDTHLGKNAFAPFIQKAGPGLFRMIIDGSLITRESFQEAATQVRPTQLMLQPDDKLQGVGTYVLKRKIGEGAIGTGKEDSERDGRHI